MQKFFWLILFWICNIFSNDIVIYCIILCLCRFFGTVNSSLCYFPKLCPETNRFFEKKKVFVSVVVVYLSNSHLKYFHWGSFTGRQHFQMSFLTDTKKGFFALSSKVTVSYFHIKINHHISFIVTTLNLHGIYKLKNKMMSPPSPLLPGLVK